MKETDRAWCLAPSFESEPEEAYEMMNKNGKNEKAAAVAKFVAGAKLFFTNGNQMVPLEGTTMSVLAALTQLQTFVDNRAATVAAQATAKAKVAAEKSQAPALLALFGAFETFVRLTVGNDPPALAGFGLEPHKVPGVDRSVTAV